MTNLLAVKSRDNLSSVYYCHSHSYFVINSPMFNMPGLLVTDWLN